MSRLALAVASLALAAGCASAHTTFNTRSDLAGTQPPKRLFIVSHARSVHFDDTVYERFTSNLQAQLKACGVEPAIYSPGELDLDVKERAQKLMEEFRPDVLMVVRRAGGNVRSGSGGSSNALNFDLEAFDLRTKKTVWKGRSTFSFLTRNMWVSDEKTGEQLGALLVDQLAQDGLVKGCPPPPKT